MCDDLVELLKHRLRGLVFETLTQVAQIGLGNTHTCPGKAGNRVDTGAQKLGVGVVHVGRYSYNRP